MAGVLAQECSRALAWARATFSSGLLQTQLGVLLFCTAVLVCCALSAAAATAIFLGPLSASEALRLSQRLLRYLLAQAVLAGSLGLAQQLPLLTWLPWLAGIGELKMFVGLCKDRTAGLSVAPAVTLQRHMRTLCLLLLVLAADAAGWLLLGWQYRQRQLSRGVCLLFALDLAVVAVDAAKAALSCTGLLLDEALADSRLGLQQQAATSPAVAAAPSAAAALCSLIIPQQQQQQQHCEAAEAFYLHRFGDPLAESDVVPEAGSSQASEAAAMW
ncbi:hypothetical protein OEZ86_008148 [Tetradesmus obliquus]|nr:hypothetical protein OEZ86_008148 [Tetradesmus obliquus]